MATEREQVLRRIADLESQAATAAGLLSNAEAQANNSMAECARLRGAMEDINKQLLLRADGFISLLIDSLFLDPDHPRSQEPDFECVKGQVQLDFAEALHQVAVFEPGREALLQEPAVVPALEVVAQSGFTEEAKMSAQRTLAALNPAAVAAAPHATDAPHLMMSCTQSRLLCTARPPLLHA